MTSRHSNFPDHELAAVLAKRLERWFKECRGMAQPAEVAAMDAILVTLGEFGGDQATDYLIRLFEDDALLRKIRCRYSSHPGGLAVAIRESIIAGLGFSGNPRALRFLVSENERRDSRYTRNLQGSIQINRKVASKGIRNFLQEMDDAFVP